MNQGNLFTLKELCIFNLTGSERGSPSPNNLHMILHKATLTYSLIESVWSWSSPQGLRLAQLPGQAAWSGVIRDLEKIVFKRNVYGNLTSVIDKKPTQRLHTACGIG